jgi:hypothetical protein
MPQIEFAGPFIPLVGSDLRVEDLSSQIQEGGTTTFTVNEEFQSERLLVYLNGLFQGPPNGSEITINTTTTFTIATSVLLGDNLTVVYSPLNKQQ